MKKRHKSLIDYTEKKTQRRLFTLAKAPQRENVLIIYDQQADLKKSKDFYSLLLECMDSWGLKYGATNPRYLADRKKLIEMRVLPVGVHFMNIPGSDDELMYSKYDDVDAVGLRKLTSNKNQRA